MKKYRKLKSLKFLYEISNDGELRNVKSKKITKWNKHPEGYYMAGINNKILGVTQPSKKKPGKTIGKRVNLRQHRLVAEAWVPFPKRLENEPRVEVHHIDFNPSNNHYKNLMWVTPKENVAFSYNEDRFYSLDKALDVKRVKIRIEETGEIFKDSVSAAKWVIENSPKEVKGKIDSIRRRISRVSLEKNNYCYGYHFTRISNDYSVKEVE